MSENLILDHYKKAPFASGPAMKPPVIQANAEKLRDEFDIRLTNVSDAIEVWTWARSS